MNRLRKELQRVAQEMEQLGRPVTPPPRMPPPQRQWVPRPSVDREGREAEGSAPPAPAGPPTTPPLTVNRAPNLARALSSRAALRQAIILGELLGPPLALRGPAGDHGEAAASATRAKGAAVNANGWAHAPGCRGGDPG